jgi:signal transduction histidine kinase
VLNLAGAYELNAIKQLFADQLARSEEHERRRMAREMHELTIQDLVAIGMNLRRLDHLSDNAEIGDILTDIQGIISRSQVDIRTMSYLLHPPLLGDGGLVPALSSLITGIAKRMKIRVEFHTNVEDTRLTQEAENTLYRISLEALINVHKHASATYVGIELIREQDDIVLTVDDNGVGIDALYGCNVETCVGIPGMRARLSAVGGLLTVSQLDPGTSLRAVIPAGSMAT